MCERVNTELARDVDQERDLHAVGLLQRDCIECTSTAGRLAGEGLANLAQTGVEQRKYRASGQFIDSTSPVGMLCRGRS